MSRLGDVLAVTGFRLGWGTVRRLPERAAYAAFDRIADLTVARGGKGVERLRSNYAKARPELDDRALDALVRAGMRSYLRYYCEAFRLPDRSTADIAGQVRVVGDAPVRAELGAGRPVVCFLGHLGNWDLAGAWGTKALGPVVTVAERLEPEEVYAEFLEFRESLGMTILPLTGGGDVFAQLRGHLASPVLMPLLADRDLTDRGIEVDLLGHRSKMAAGPAALALGSGAALHPVSIHYERVPGSRRHGLVITFHERVEVPATGATRAKAVAMTQQCADVLGAAIREHTEDWHMLQRVFLDDLEPRPARPAAAEVAP
ncbi:lipid A biosynthesis acyltransferase [Phycicoccus sp. Root563]|uniref:phosphatidylinositol mannoside acyltransferase n=1 Tax=unclassified Phycicoccus TaxID=2637926 RepID=UPI0007034940|nr:MULTISPECIES: phosphatidylinositol mannoside acyltransferase [unclassified Phycicoccus]KQU68761.1 lipid A biosynthesis acyltransferase [Phycicoccus sp. Root101]KQZ88253.1 lipid A biosynthesis acyltransferase [Phycicoccus sp. Root563]